MLTPLSLGTTLLSSPSMGNASLFGTSFMSRVWLSHCTVFALTSSNLVVVLLVPLMLVSLSTFPSWFCQSILPSTAILHMSHWERWPCYQPCTTSSCGLHLPFILPKVLCLPARPLLSQLWWVSHPNAQRWSKTILLWPPPLSHSSQLPPFT
jgi:hypothetical protein